LLVRKLLQEPALNSTACSSEAASGTCTKFNSLLVRSCFRNLHYIQQLACQQLLQEPALYTTACSSAAASGTCTIYNSLLVSSCFRNLH
jgi:hypothetical protein